MRHTVFGEKFYTVADKEDYNLKIGEFFGPYAEVLARAFLKALNSIEWQDILRNGGYLRRAKKRRENFPTFSKFIKLVGGTV